MLECMTRAKCHKIFIKSRKKSKKNQILIFYCQKKSQKNLGKKSLAEKKLFVTKFDKKITKKKKPFLFPFLKYLFHLLSNTDLLFFHRKIK